MECSLRLNSKPEAPKPAAWPRWGLLMVTSQGLMPGTDFCQEMGPGQLLITSESCPMEASMAGLAVIGEQWSRSFLNARCHVGVAFLLRTMSHAVLDAALTQPLR